MVVVINFIGVLWGIVVVVIIVKGLIDIYVVDVGL